ncbi:MAG: uroporphyrinogen-III synthase [Deinococcus sp.]|nr:uroporphyrinogen-III synthase [Deinococcus sp.]
MPGHLPNHAPSSSCVGRAVVTLTGTGGEQLTARLRQAGWQAALWPGLTFRPTGQVGPLLREEVKEADWVVLTSPQGVRSLILGLEELGAAALAAVKVAAVGEGTARPLAAWGRTPDFMPTQADARTLAAQLPAGAGERLLHVTGVDSRDHLQRGLQERGVLYRRLELYRSCAVSYSAQARRDLLAADWVVVGSGVAARGLAAQLGGGLPLLAMGSQTAAAARAAGFAQVVQAREPSLEGVLVTLAELVCPA